MAVELKRVALPDEVLQTFQQNVADAVDELSKSTPVGVIRVNASRKLVGNEDYVLVDASGATTELSLVLPSPKQLQRALRVKVTRAGSSAVRIKSVDIPGTGSPTIDGNVSVAIPAGAEEGLTIVSDGRNFNTV